MQIYDPTVTGPERNFSRAAPLVDLSGAKIGVLENGKLNAMNLLRGTAEVFAAKHGGTVVPIYSKANASAPAPVDTLADAAGSVDFLITGLGD